MPARLVALTPDARTTLKGDALALERFPFRVGRESRTPLGRAAAAVERRIGTSQQLNDLYIEEDAEFLNVSREHFLIEAAGATFFLVDRGSACGTIVEGQLLGGDRAGGRAELHDHDVIIVGTASSPFVFKFRRD